MNSFKFWQQISSSAMFSSSSDFLALLMNGFSTFSSPAKCANDNSRFSIDRLQCKGPKRGNALKFRWMDHLSNIGFPLKNSTDFSTLFQSSIFRKFLSDKFGENVVVYVSVMLAVHIALKDFLINTLSANASEIAKTSSDTNHSEYGVLDVETLGSPESSNSFDEIFGYEQGEFSTSCLIVNPRTSDEIVEPETTIKFPTMLRGDEIDKISSNGSSCQVLAGVGLRRKSIIKLKSIKVYAFALYVNTEKLKTQLGKKYGQMSPKSLKLNHIFFDDILSSEVDMTIRLVVHYKGLSMKMVKNAFETSLKNRFAKYKQSHENDDAMDSFIKYFTLPLDVSRGTTIDFCWKSGGKFVTKIEGKTMEPIQSRTLCQSFFDLYLGDPPTCPKAKLQIGQSLVKLLSE